MYNKHSDRIILAAMGDLRIKTERLLITKFDESMAASVHFNSLDEDNRRFLPDEVFETIEKAQDVIQFLIRCYSENGGPFVYPVLLSAGNENIGHVQAVSLNNGSWEVGYHIAKKYTENGYAAEAVKAFVPVITKLLGISGIWGICRTDNIASCRVLEKSGFELQHKMIANYHGEQHEVCKYLYNTPI